MSYVYQQHEACVRHSYPRYSIRESPAFLVILDVQKQLLHRLHSYPPSVLHRLHGGWVGLRPTA